MSASLIATPAAAVLEAADRVRAYIDEAAVRPPINEQIFLHGILGCLRSYAAEIEDQVQVLDLHDGDVLMVLCQRQLTPSTRGLVRDSLGYVLPEGVRIVVFDGDPELALLRNETCTKLL